jgi:hypothetical protein
MGQQERPRVTRIGQFMRKTRVDELPQAWTVLKGEMSFVGPRPERPEFVADLEEKLRYYAERHMVKPGITGWAQVNYPYGASIEDLRNKLEYDLYYVKNYTPFLDILIILQTLRVVIWHEGRDDTRRPARPAPSGPVGHHRQRDPCGGRLRGGDSGGVVVEPARPFWPGGRGDHRRVGLQWAVVFGHSGRGRAA